MKIFLTCKEASRIISEGLDSELPFHKKFLMRLHLLMCKTCGFYKDQIEALKKMLSQDVLSDHLSSQATLPEDARKNITEILKDKSV